MESDELKYRKQIEALEAELVKGLPAEEGAGGPLESEAEEDDEAAPLEDQIADAERLSAERLEKTKASLQAQLATMAAPSPPSPALSVPPASALPQETVVAAGSCFITILKASAAPADIITTADALLDRLSGHKRSGAEVLAAAGSTTTSRSSAERPAKKAAVINAATKAPIKDAASPVPLDLHEKRSLSKDMALLNQAHIDEVLQIISERMPLDTNGSGEVELDMDALDTATLRELQRYVAQCLNRRRPLRK